MYGEWKEVTDAPIKKEDRVTMDYKGFLNGETFEGGTATEPEEIVKMAKEKGCRKPATHIEKFTTII